ncbi:hypothetical protein EVAR_37080_1 [Eumeta japonica]|uniref:Uncharacterized protein n=1 Tax=Eumeta variegata TaxID=151549 RepID=A0A4C1WIS0_EUMVA|nr:hypothetical protein EVAR_37080_1 [Eumeta japonica]
MRPSSHLSVGRRVRRRALPYGTLSVINKVTVTANARGISHCLRGADADLYRRGPRRPRPLPGRVVGPDALLRPRPKRVLPSDGRDASAELWDEMAEAI